MGKRALTIPGIDKSILLLRGGRVMLDTDLARLYGVTTGALNRAVKRNRFRFPADFMFRLTVAEVAEVLRCQSGISKEKLAKGSGGRRYQPYAFTEQGVAMLSSVLKSRRAVEVNIEIVRIFVRLRHAAAFNAELTQRLAVVESRMDQHHAETGKKIAEHERHIRVVFETIRQLMVEEGDSAPPSRIGFKTT